MISQSPLLKLTSKEWEELCDGCGRCCLVKLQDEDTEEIAYTNVACEYLDLNSCRCSDYENRAKIKPECVVLSRSNLEVLESMPFTCAYRLKHENRSITETVDELSITGAAVSELYIDDEQLPEHLIDWVSVTSCP